jgi:hypothetical protein
MRLIQSMLNASVTEITVFRAYLRERYTVRSGMPPEDADRAFEELADNHRVSVFADRVRRRMSGELPVGRYG